MLFHAFTFTSLYQACCLNTRLLGQVLKYLLREPANVNAMKQTYVILILAFNLIPAKIAHANTLNYPFS